MQPSCQLPLASCSCVLLICCFLCSASMLFYYFPFPLLFLLFIFSHVSCCFAFLFFLLLSCLLLWISTLCMSCFLCFFFSAFLLLLFLFLQSCVFAALLLPAPSFAVFTLSEFCILRLFCLYSEWILEEPYMKPKDTLVRNPKTFKIDYTEKKSENKQTKTPRHHKRYSILRNTLKKLERNRKWNP